MLFEHGPFSKRYTCGVGHEYCDSPKASFFLRIAPVGRDNSRGLSRVPNFGPMMKPATRAKIWILISPKDTIRSCYFGNDSLVDRRAATLSGSITCAMSIHQNRDRQPCNKHQRRARKRGHVKTRPGRTKIALAIQSDHERPLISLDLMTLISV